MEHSKAQFNFQGKVVVVTGANGQLGNRLCEMYRQAGATVVGLDLNSTAGLQDGVHYFPLDIRIKADVEKTFRTVADTLGPIDILVNNAGVSIFEPFEDRSEEQFDWVMDVNLKGTFFCIQSYVREYDRRHGAGGSIVNIASLYGIASPDWRIYTDCPRKNSEVYGATKAGVIQLTKYFGVHLAPRGIRVNAVSPGGVYNPKNPQGVDFIKNYSSRCPMGRMAQDSEIPGSVLFLSSNAASYITGHNLVVDGGMSSW